MDTYKNKKAELRAWAKDDIVPSDLQWLCKASAEIIDKLQAENERLKKELKWRDDHCPSYMGNNKCAEVDDVAELQAELAKAKEEIKIAHEHLTGDDPYGYATKHTLTAIDTLEQALKGE